MGAGLCGETDGNGAQGCQQRAWLYETRRRVLGLQQSLLFEVRWSAVFGWHMERRGLRAPEVRINMHASTQIASCVYRTGTELVQNCACGVVCCVRGALQRQLAGSQYQQVMRGYQVAHFVYA